MKTRHPSADVPAAVKRRMSGRFRAVVELPARLGRKDGVLVDVSRGSARVRHAGALDVGTVAQLSFRSPHGQFSGSATVLSCRVVGKAGDGATQFESLVRFSNIGADGNRILEQVVADQET
jgi:PilZ domain-containing protein